MMQNLIGQKLGQYQIISEIGRGGMAIVYRAYQTSLNRYVAIKILPPQFTFDEMFVERFLHEARAAAGLKHPNIVTIHDVGVENGVYYIVMEEIAGRPLNLIQERESPWALERMIRIMGQIASALDFAHGSGVVHRDIKPSNILVGPGDHATLTDFGIAKAAAGTGLTRTGVIVGTPEYMSPEQAMGETVDHRADIYSLGVICYELLGGRVPFTGEMLSVMLAHAYGQPPPLRSLNPRLTPAVEQVIHTAMAKKPGERYAPAGAFVADLAAAASGQRLTSPPTANSSARRPTPLPTRSPTPAPANAPTRVRTPTPQPALPLANASPSGGITPPHRRSLIWLLPVAGVLIGIVLIAVLALRRLPTVAAPVTRIPAILSPAGANNRTPSPSPPAVTPSPSPRPKPAKTTAPPAAVNASTEETPAPLATPATPTPTATHLLTATSTRASTATPTRIVRTATATPSPSPSPTPSPEPTPTPLPPTHTPAPPPPNTAETPTNTPEEPPPPPPITDTPEPIATDTPEALFS